MQESLMNRYRLSAAAAAVAAVVTVGLAGCSGNAASKPPTAQPSATTAPASSAPAAQPSATQSSGTQVITYNPWASGGTLASGITAAATKSGYCFGASSASSASNAFRCIADNIIYDPCFTDGSSDAGECAYPSTDNPDSVTVVKLTSALPAGPATVASQIPWLLVLANGLRCLPVTGTGGPALDGKPQDYACGSGSVYGMPDENSAAWTVSYAPTGAAASAMTQVDVTTAYE
jgi:hypothetical protein